MLGWAAARLGSESLFLVLLIVNVLRRLSNGLGLLSANEPNLAIAENLHLLLRCQQMAIGQKAVARRSHWISGLHLVTSCLDQLLGRGLALRFWISHGRRCAHRLGSLGCRGGLVRFSHITGLALRILLEHETWQFGATIC